jgi:hypothetical protein
MSIMVRRKILCRRIPCKVFGLMTDAVFNISSVLVQRHNGICFIILLVEELLV